MYYRSSHRSVHTTHWLLVVCKGASEVYTDYTRELDDLTLLVIGIDHFRDPDSCPRH